ncbi:MAG: N-acetylmuramoyl-L-alanine amidase [Bdellovibrio sp.]|nr:MAG: N-acetylmuramoyl-L-alanine amidase [Bdellovibrio sp.]
MAAPPRTLYAEEMKRFNFAFFRFFMITLFMATLSAWREWAAAAPMTVMIDPGHGGVDVGASQPGIKESDLVLHVALLLRDLLNKDENFSAQMTRAEDVRVSLPERVNRAEMAKADLFISLHANSSTDPRARGMEVYLLSHLPADEDALLIAAIENEKQSVGGAAQVGASGTSADATGVYPEESAPHETLSKRDDVSSILSDLKRDGMSRSSLKLSRIVAHKWPLDDHRSSKPVRQAPFYVINKSRSPSILIELGFLSHQKDREALKQRATQEKVARAIYSSLAEFRHLTSLTRP